MRGWQGCWSEWGGGWPVRKGIVPGCWSWGWWLEFGGGGNGTREHRALYVRVGAPQGTAEWWQVAVLSREVTGSDFALGRITLGTVWAESTTGG